MWGPNPVGSGWWKVGVKIGRCLLGGVFLRTKKPPKIPRNTPTKHSVCEHAVPSKGGDHRRNPYKIQGGKFCAWAQKKRVGIFTLSHGGLGNPPPPDGIKSCARWFWKASPKDAKYQATWGAGRCSTLWAHTPADAGGGVCWTRGLARPTLLAMARGVSP